MVITGTIVIYGYELWLFTIFLWLLVIKVINLLTMVCCYGPYGLWLLLGGRESIHGISDASGTYHQGHQPVTGMILKVTMVYGRYIYEW